MLAKGASDTIWTEDLQGELRLTVMNEAYGKHLNITREEETNLTKQKIVCTTSACNCEFCMFQRNSARNLL